MSIRWLMTVALCLVSVPALGQELPAGLEVYLRTVVGMDSAQIMTVRRGAAFVNALDTKLSREIAVFGIARIGLSREAYVRAVLDPGGSTRPATRGRFGIFSRPPVPADVKDVVVAERDVSELKDCRPGTCVVKLPTAAMTSLREGIDWSAGDAPARVSALARQGLVAYVADYLARGNAALVVYDDRGDVHASEVFADLLAATPLVYQYAPALQRYLVEYPARALPEAADVVFWSEDGFPRLRPVLSVTHLVVYSPPEHPGLTLVAAKQVYANHYFDGAFDLTCLVAPAGAGQGGYLVTLRRYRFDQLSSGGPMDLRRRVVDAMRRNLLTDLQHLQTISPPERTNP